MNLGRFRAAQMCLVDDVNLQNPPSARRRRNPAELPSVEVPAHALGKRFRPTHASPSRTGGDRYSGANELNRSEVRREACLELGTLFCTGVAPLVIGLCRTCRWGSCGCGAIYAMCDLRRRPAWPSVLPPLGLLLSRSAFFARHIFSQKLVSQGNELLQLLALDGRISSHVFVSCAAIVPVESPSE